ncbi:hypothetical protein ACROYT_G005667 [Oculina patagonica]
MQEESKINQCDEEDEGFSDKTSQAIANPSQSIDINLYQPTSVDSEDQLVALTVFVSTGRIMVQGKMYEEWCANEFPVLLDIVNTIEPLPTISDNGVFTSSLPQFFKNFVQFIPNDDIPSSGKSNIAKISAQNTTETPQTPRSELMSSTLTPSRLKQISSLRNTLGELEAEFTQHKLISDDKIQKAIDNKNYSCGVFIDLCKAFDTVDHHILLDKLEYYAQPPFFGLDIGGSLAKLVYFVPCQSQKISPDGQGKVGLDAMQDFIESNARFAEIGTKDESLTVKNVVLGERKGHIHFMYFPNDVMDKFLLAAKECNATVVNTKMGATGGGAFRFEEKFQEVRKRSKVQGLDSTDLAHRGPIIPKQETLGIQLEKYDEFECLVRGLHFINSRCDDGCYYWNNLHSPEEAEKVSYDFDADSYPYLLVNIGSGVGILLVESADKFKQISGTW